VSDFIIYICHGYNFLRATQATRRRHSNKNYAQPWKGGESAMRESSYTITRKSRTPNYNQGGEMKVMKKSFALLLAFAMIFSMFAGVGSANTETPLQKLQAAGVIIGGTGVSDSDTWTRQDVAVLLSRLYGKESVAMNYDNTHGFTDVANSYYNGFISWAKDEGIMKGRNATTFGYGDTVTAQEFATVVLRVIDIDDYANATELAIAAGILPAGTANSKLLTRGETYTSLVAALNTEVSAGKTLGANLGLKGWAPIVVNTIQLTSVDVDNNTAGQKLTFTINNEKDNMDVAKLTAEGYTVQFQATIAGFSAPAPTNNAVTSTSGSIIDLSTIGYNIGSNFEYKVVITKGSTVVESASKQVKVIDYAVTPVSVDGADLMMFTPVGQVLISSGKIASQDTVVEVTNVKVTFKDGKQRTFAYDTPAAKWRDKAITVAPFFETAITFTSSNNNFALVGNDGKVTPISAGTVQFTIKAGDNTKSVFATVVNGKRAATSATVSKSAVKFVYNSEDTFVLTVADQFGDPFPDFNKAGGANGTITFNELKTSAGDVFAAGAIQAAPNDVTDNSGKITLKVTGNATAKAGTGTLQVKNGSTVLGTVNVSISNDLVAATKGYELVDTTKDLTLDLFADNSDNKVQVVFNNYNAGGFKIGGYDFTTKVNAQPAAPFVLVYASSDTSIITVAPVVVNGTDGKIEVTAVKAGTAKLNVTEGGIVRYSLNITVVNNTPKPTTATFVTTEKITAAGEYKLSKVLTGIKDQAGKALFIDTVTGTDVQTKATTGGVAQGTKVGTVEAKSSTTGFGATFAASIGLNGSGDSVIFINGANPVAGQKGNVVVIVRNLAGDPVATFDLEINIP
jgi:hypothetical protein